MRTHSSIRKSGLSATALALLFAGSLTSAAPTDPAFKPDPVAEIAFGPIGSGEAVLHMFQWPWQSVARECTDTLGPAGFPAIEVSAPQEHVVLPDQGFPWWQDYQPVSYELDSRRGSAADFAAMVLACDTAGVEVYIDAVVNHMTGDGVGGTGSAGNPFTHYEYPAVPYGDNDFHHCGRNGDDDIRDWTNRWEVQNCELLNLADLKTESPYVRQQLSRYLQDLIDLGVDGFRIDAAKHMPVADFQAVFGALQGDPKIFLEVIEGGNGEISPTEYTGLGRVTEFRYGDQVGARFKDGNLSALQSLESHMLLGSADAMTFIDNHDTQRSGRAPLTYKDGARYRMAQAFNLAHGYGSPHLLTGFEFTSADQGPPAEADGTTTQAIDAAGDCVDGWDCLHRERTVLNMGAFRASVGSAATGNWWSNGSQIGFGRGDRGYAAFNATGSPLSRTFATSLPAGTYCDVANGDFADAAEATCSGPSYSVDASGLLTATVPANGVLAVHVDAMTEGEPTDPGEPGDCQSGVLLTFNTTATTFWGQNVHVVGSIAELGGWSPADAVPLTTTSASYPNWTSQTVTVPAGTSFEYKYIKKHQDQVVWESDPDRVFSPPADSCLAATSDHWR